MDSPETSKETSSEVPQITVEKVNEGNEEVKEDGTQKKNVAVSLSPRDMKDIALHKKLDDKITKESHTPDGEVSALERAIDVTEAEMEVEEEVNKKLEATNIQEDVILHKPDVKRKSLISEQRKMKWARKHEKIHKYKHEHNKDPAWFKHKKHILICSWAGRPIYTRYGDDTTLSAYMGVISAIISNFQNHGDKLRSIIAGKHKFVFLLCGPIYLVCVSRTPESVKQLEKQLEFVHQQIVSVLTGSIHSILEQRPGYDIRNLMGGMEHLLTDLISESNKNPCFLFNSIQCLPLNKHVRSKIGAILRKNRIDNLLYSFLLADTKLIHLAQAKERPMKNDDLLLLINFVTNSQSLRSSESWTPVCLPNFNDQGFLYAYVCFLADDICLTLIASSSEDFYLLKESKDNIVDGLENNGLLEDIHAAVASQKVYADDLETSVPEFRHFLYKSISNSQSLAAEYAVPFTTKHSQKALFQRYQLIHSKLVSCTTSPNVIYYEVSDFVTILAWYRPGEFEMYAAFSPLVSKEAATTACNRSLRWIKKEEESLFIMNPANF